MSIVNVCPGYSVARYANAIGPYLVSVGARPVLYPGPTSVQNFAMILGRRRVAFSLGVLQFALTPGPP